MPRVLFLRVFAGLVLTSVCLFATDPRPKPTDYPAHAESADLAIGAEYLVHSFSNGSQMYDAPQYLVVDTAVYPHGPLDVKRAQFSLRVTLQGKSHQADETINVPAEAPQMVTYAITSSINSLPSDMRNPAGQRRPSASPLPRPSDQTSPMDAAQGAPEDLTAVVTRMSLPEDITRSAQGGYLFFSFAGKTKKIKTLDLVYGDGDGALVVKLF